MVGSVRRLWAATILALVGYLLYRMVHRRDRQTVAKLSERDLQKIVEKQAPGFRVSPNQTVRHRRAPIEGAGKTPGLDVIQQRFSKVAPRKASGIRRMAAPSLEGPTTDDDESSAIEAVIIEPKDGAGSMGPKSVLIDTKTKKIISAQG
jgi:hypothetical protein